jgi:DNA gyrase subunit B
LRVSAKYNDKDRQLKDFQDQMTSDNQNQQGQIIELDAREHVRRRPGMYFSGGIDFRAMHRLAMIVLENSVNRALLGQCTQIAVTIEDGTQITIEDNGPGIPTNLHSDTGKTVLELVMIHGQKGHCYDEQHDRFISGGIDNAGISAVNSGSTQLEVEVKRGGKVWFQQFVQGLPRSELLVTREMLANEATGTRITFTPDFDIFEQSDFDPAYFAYRLNEYAYLLPQTTFTLREVRNGQQISEKIYKSERGIADYLEVLNRDKTVLHEPLVIQSSEELQTYESKTMISARVEVALQYVDEPDFLLLSYVNAVPTPLTHPYIAKIMDSLFNELISPAGYLAYEWQHLEFTDVTSGLTAIINILDPQAIGYRTRYQGRDGQSRVRDVISKIIFDATVPQSDELRVISQAVRAKCEANRKHNAARKIGK